jgi:tetratricopeptide (TPR) repeat protein
MRLEELRKRLKNRGIYLSLPLAAVLFFIVAVTPATAEMKSFVREYTYNATDVDNRISCRAIALEQVKRSLLEELGTYVESVTVVKDNQVEKDRVTALTAGVVQTTVIDENWNGRDYWLKAKLNADPDEVNASINKLKNDEQLTKDLEQSRREAAEALKEIDDLKKQLADVSADQEKQKQYVDAVNRLAATDWYEKGQSYAYQGNYTEAVKAYDRVIIIRPNDPRAYSYRGAAYVSLRRYDRAVTDLDRAIALNPGNTRNYAYRDTAYRKLPPAERKKFSARPPQPGLATVQKAPSQPTAAGSVKKDDAAKDKKKTVRKRLLQKPKKDEKEEDKREPQEKEGRPREHHVR